MHFRNNLHKATRPVALIHSHIFQFETDDHRWNSSLTFNGSLNLVTALGCHCLRCSKSTIRTASWQYWIYPIFASMWWNTLSGIWYTTLAKTDILIWLFYLQIVFFFQLNLNNLLYHNIKLHIPRFYHPPLLIVATPRVGYYLYCATVCVVVTLFWLSC